MFIAAGGKHLPTEDGVRKHVSGSQEDLRRSTLAIARPALIPKIVAQTL
jgi:hypothetical protein